MNDSSVLVRINGEDHEVPSDLNVAALLEHLELHPRMVVVEQNGEILRRDSYEAAPVSEGDAFELVHFVGGG